MMPYKIWATGLCCDALSRSPPPSPAGYRFPETNSNIGHWNKCAHLGVEILEIRPEATL
jgi:hypothetical protein